MGPRIGRFNEDNSESLELKGHSVPFTALGGFILMFGFLAFNGGSTGAISPEGTGNTVALAMTNTILCGSFAALTCLFIFYVRRGKLSLLLSINAALAGMVAACAGCDASQPWTTAITGSGAAIMYILLSNAIVRFKIDDPLDAFAVHFGGGSWGLITTCFLRDDGILPAIFTNDHIGHAFLQLLWQIICWLSIIVWSLLWMIPIFILLKKIGKLRIPAEIEVKGLDIYMHGESAYPLHAYGHGWDDVEAVRKMTAAKKLSNGPVPELSLEQLASAYEASTLGNEDRKKSVYHNPQHYEHPEFHHKGFKKIVPKPTSRAAVIRE
ncbi:hypothetical protein WR25_00153 [Diploscapter pachys]|uniref:Ammonium transporter AmtB-like domain-containing protein n=1 Tax=Diploscapter pachys TaxID=2018661 RepID=A0A2A2JL63_9BILA|nr:hypothetical protein WR25_00153 [Diploscapter pachys]